MQGLAQRDSLAARGVARRKHRSGTAMPSRASPSQTEAETHELKTGSNAPSPEPRTLERALGAQIRATRRSHDLSVADLAAA